MGKQAKRRDLPESVDQNKKKTMATPKKIDRLKQKQHPKEKEVSGSIVVWVDMILPLTLSGGAGKANEKKSWGRINGGGTGQELPQNAR